MPTEIEALVLEHLERVLPDLPPEGVELDGDLVADYGLSSLNRVLLLTSVCAAADVDLGAFTAEQVATLATPREVAEALAGAKQKVG